jgi:hypothetical protein
MCYRIEHCGALNTHIAILPSSGSKFANPRINLPVSKQQFARLKLIGLIHLGIGSLRTAQVRQCSNLTWP